jgi:hypothetical protein
MPALGKNMKRKERRKKKKKQIQQMVSNNYSLHRFKTPECKQIGDLEFGVGSTTAVLIVVYV